jgi:CxxC motif-containing protein (DUF1111 family)
LNVRWLYGVLLLAAGASARFAASPAGRATVAESGRAAFTQHVPDLDERQLKAFALGNRIFSTDWIAAPASVEYFDGLGPYFSQRSCSGCHLRDGRGRPGLGTPEEPGNLVIGLAREDGEGGLAPDPGYGEQLSERALPGLAPEGRVSVTWLEKSVFFADGQVVSLRRPQYEVVDMGYGPLGEGTAIQPRLAPAMPGVGLLEAIPDSAILAREDPDDRDHDGVSGRARRVTTSDGVRVGRFGWKAGMVTIRDQVARALRLDIGITSRLHPGSDETAVQTEAVKRPNGGSPEITDEALDAIAAYCATLGVPARRDVNDPSVLRGNAAFDEAGCARCHGGMFLTGASPFAALAHQRIEPGTDLLLHDMGPDLAERVSARAASGSEWRTPPLWGLGLHEHVTGYRFLLHDGRARTLTEAILWHGGEAGASRDAFAKMPAAKRRDLLTFLESL